MAGWLPGFRSSGTEASTEPQPFELVCECNQRHLGMRRKGHQRIVCRSCGVSLFVLPRDVYPPPPASEAIKKPPKPRPASAPLDPDEPAPVRVSRTKRRREQEQARGPAHPFAAAAGLTSSAFAAAAGAAARSTQATARRVSKASVDTAVGVWKFWTPLKLAALGICALITGLAIWTVHSRRIETAEKNLNPAIEEGLAALGQGDVSTAASRLHVAVEALDLLQQDDRHSQSVRQAAREATALDTLVTEPLLALLEQADESVRKAAAARPPQSDPEAEPPPPLDLNWVNRFGALYQGSWIGLEAPVRRLPPAPEEPIRFEVQFPVGIGPHQRPVELRADFRVFDALSIHESPRTVVFAGRLQSCRFDEASQTFQVQLEPDSGFLWVNLPTYRQLGFMFSDWHREEDVQALLTAQAKALDVDALVKDSAAGAAQHRPQRETAQQ